MDKSHEVEGGTREKLEPLGASEFAATLNGDNPNAILRALKSFTKTVRRERRVALSVEDESDDDGGSSSEDSDDDEKNQGSLQPPTKKLKKTEIWKEDTNEYQVPFVGTAVSRGDLAPVVKGQWPTGLLQAYLAKSPMAMELTNDDWIPSTHSVIHKSLLRRKQMKLSRAIYKAYLKALTELVTASIPVEKLRDDLSSVGDYSENDKGETDEESQVHPFLAAILKKRLVGMFHLLVEETDNGRGKPGVYGGCGSLVPFALRFLQNVARTSVANARLVCRYLDETLSDGVIRAILRPPPPPRTAADSADEKPLIRKPSAKPSRTEAVRLATILLGTRDSAVAAYICTAGSRERKVKPGILFVAFREGLAKHSQAGGFGHSDDADDYFGSISDMIEESRKTIQDPRVSRIVGPKLLMELLARDPLYHLCDLSSHAPPLTSNQSYHKVLSGTDARDVGDLETLSYAGTEARRLLFYLLATPAGSPVLGNISSKTQAHSLVNVLLRLLQAKGAGIQVRYFIHHCLKATPTLLPEFFCVVSVPDSKKELEFMSTLRFISTIMETGPSSLSCLNVSEEALVGLDFADILGVLWPLKLKRQVIGKAMQSANLLVVLECLKFVRTALLRLQALLVALSGDKDARELSKRLSSEFAQLIPDLQVIVALRSKFDLAVRSRGHDLVYHALHLVLQDYATVLPNQIRMSSFDWMKLTPEPTMFLNITPVVQRKTLSCLCTILRICTEMHASYTRSIGEVLQIMLRTRDNAVYSCCREIASILLLSIVGYRTKNGESLEYGRLEVSWWLDALTLSSVSDFCSILSLCTDDSLEVLGRTGKAVARSTESSKLTWTIILMASLSERKVADEFFQMTIQVASRSLLVQRNPVPFAAFVASLNESMGGSGALGTSAGQRLVKYATTLVDYERTSADSRLGRLTTLVNAVFEPQHEFRRLLSWSVQNGKNGQLSFQSLHAAVELSRFCIHAFLVASEAKAACFEVLRRTISSLLLPVNGDLKTLTAQVIEDVQLIEDGTSLSLVDILISSKQGLEDQCLSFVRSPFLALLKEESSMLSLQDQRTRIDILRLPLLGRRLSVNDLVKVQLRLLVEGDSVVPRTKNPKNLQVALNIGKLVDDRACSIVGSEIYGFGVLEEVFQAWWSPFQPDTPVNGGGDLGSQLLTFFAGLISRLLSSESSVAATYILTLATKYSEDAVIGRCLCLDQEPERVDQIKANASVLDSLLQCDPLRYAPYFFAYFDREKFVKSTIWRAGFLNGVTKQLLGHSAIHSIDQSPLSPFGIEILARAKSCLKEILKGKNLRGQLDVLSTLDLANRAISMGFAVPGDDFVASVTASLCLAFEDREFLIEIDLEYVAHLGMTIFAKNSKESSLSRQSCSALFSSLFYVLSDLLLTRYKKSAYTNETKTTLDSAAILEFLTVLIVDVAQYFDPITIGRAKGPLLQKVCRAALKHGIHGEEKPAPLAALSLKYVRVLLEQFHRSPTLVKQFATIEPAEIFSMLKSHSKFPSMMTRTKSLGAAEIDRVELVRLMHCCVENAPDKTKVDKDVWELFNHAFGGGLDAFDTTVRRFFSLCSSVESKTIFVPFLDEIRWAACSRADSREGKRWEWLEDALDINRVRETLAHFPIDDRLDLKTYQATTSLVDQMDRDAMDVQDSNDDETPGDHNVRATKSAMTLAAFDENFSTEITRTPTKDATDSRYSPAFILPHILGALHYYIDKVDHETDTKNVPETEEIAKVYTSASEKSRVLVALVKRLVDKGIPALCLASLASSCDKVRLLAISILGVFLAVCDSAEARAFSQWRDRPQVAMLLNAVQRAFVIKRAERGRGSLSDIPKLPPLVSTFLARSSMSISKPDDPMYVPLNRFFLKSDADCGAFQDMNRLPGFISLFCSASDDPLQSRKERIWALHLIQDGFQNPSSFRLVCSCHVPELLLSSFENVRLSSFSNEMKSVEYNLLFEIIKTFLVKGGRQAASHLFGRIGLLSWIRSLLTSRPVTSLFSEASTRVAACELIEAAAKSVWSNPNFLGVPLLDEICGLIGPTLELGSSQNEKFDQRITILPSARALLALSFVLRSVDNIKNAESPDLHSSGMKLGDAMGFLELVPANVLDEIIPAFYRLPLQLSHGPTEKHTAARFCVFLLDWCARGKFGDGIDGPSFVLRRVVMMTEHFGGEFPLEANEKLAQMLLSSRARYQGAEESSLLWLELLELVSLRLPDESIVAQLATDVLNQL